MAATTTPDMADHEYRIRISERDRVSIVHGLAGYIIERVRAARKSVNIEDDVTLHQRLAKPSSLRPSRPYWAIHWLMSEKRKIYKRIRELEANGTSPPVNPGQSKGGRGA